MKEIKIWPGFEQLRRARILKWKENMCCRHFSIPSEPLFMAESPVPQLLVTSEADSSRTHVSLGSTLGLRELSSPRSCSLQDCLRPQMQPHCTSASPNLAFPTSSQSRFPQFFTIFSSSLPCE